MNLQVDWKQKVIEIRKDCNLPFPSRNIAIARCFIEGEHFEEFAVSGKNAYKGVELPGQPIFNLLNPPPGHDRQYDSEYKLLEYIASKYIQDKKVSGKIELFTERKPCSSCQNIISQFKELFPNIEIIVSHGNI